MDRWEDWRDKKVLISILCIFALLGLIFIICFIFKSDNSEMQVEETEVSVYVEPSYIETEVMYLKHKSDVYKVVNIKEDTSVGRTTVEIRLNDEYYGESTYADSNKAYELIDFSMVASDEEHLSFEHIADKALEEGLVYEISNDEAKLFVNGLLSDGYIIDTQVATNVYNDIYLSNESEGIYYRIIIVNNQNTMLLSELDELVIDTDSILELNKGEVSNEQKD